LKILLNNKNYFTLLFIALLIAGCSGSIPVLSNQKKQTLSLTDVSGKYVLFRESKLLNKKLVTRTKISPTRAKKNVEKSIVVSNLGTIKDGDKRLLVLMPYAAEFEVWLEGKRYFSRMTTDTKDQSMKVESEGLETTHQWYGTKSIKFPNSKYFCFYGQIPECLFQMGFLQQMKSFPDYRKEFIVVWDSFPFTQELFTGVGKNLFAFAEIKFLKEEKNRLVYEVDLDGQLVLYYFSKSFELAKIIWIAQGITILPPGEESAQND